MSFSRLKSLFKEKTGGENSFSVRLQNFFFFLNHRTRNCLCIIENATEADGSTTTPFQPSKDLWKLLTNAAIASSAVYEADPSKYLEDSTSQHSLVFTGCAHSTNSQEKSFNFRPLPWIICATHPINSTTEDRTWFISFRSKQSFVSAFENPAFVSIPSKIIQRGGFLNGGFDNQRFEFDPACVIPWLGANNKHRVVLCGHSFGGCQAVFEFLRILQIDTIDIQSLISKGRCVNHQWRRDAC